MVSSAISAGLVAIAAALLPVVPPGFAPQKIAKVRDRTLESSKASWELGAAAQALTEYSWPSLSVFNSSAFPPPSRLDAANNASDVLAIAYRTVSTRPSDSLALIANQGSAADPASIGVAVLLANWTRTDLSNGAYADAAGNQLAYLLGDVPRTSEGAISHRAKEVQLWADFVYMVPPFIAYFGALEGGQGERNLLQIAYDQCRLYRDGLKDDSGLWRHIALGSWQDDTHWATGNGWAAAGMLRVLQTMNHTTQARQFSGHQANLTRWIQEITTASWKYQQPNGALLNVIDDPDSFADTAATALLASVTYRMAAFTKNYTLIPFANKALALIQASVDSDGWLQGTVNPYTFHTPTEPDKYSPEGQAFVLLLHAAWRAFAQSITRK